ncbi:MAG: protein kinase [Candidatus Hydrogenedentes bacterium]|nr:protein kinase [Candidatus Hydrogenedentota bacterium]
MDRDRNLLFGVFAVRLKGISPQNLMDAAAQWALDPSRDISERLVEAKIITMQDREVLLQLVDGAIQAHGGRSEDALHSLGGMKAVEDSFMGSLQETAEGLSWAIATKAAPLGQFRQQELPIVREVPGRYTRPSERARGGMGRVLIVHDEQLEREIVLKELLPSKSASGGEDLPPTPVRRTGELLARFLREAKVTGQLEHPSIVPVYELGSREDGSVYYTMKLVRGETLGEKLKNSDTLNERFRYLQHFADLCQAMAYAHSRGVIHRDLKPSNIMIGEFGETVVIDWGLAKITGQDDANEERLKKSLVKFKEEQDQADVTADGEVLGTPLYMAPEQARGEIQAIDERSDVYSLGAILYQILVGRTPFSGRSTAEILQHVAYDTPEPVERALPDCPPELAAICNRAMANEAEARYRNAKLLAEEVQNYLTGALVSAYSYSFYELLRRYCRRHRTLVSVSAAFTAALLVLAVWSYANISRARDRESAQRQVAETVSYRSQIKLVQEYMANNNYPLARETLWKTQEDQRNFEWGYLLNQCYPEQRSIPGFAGAAYSPDGSRLATWSKRGAPLTLWDGAGIQKLLEFPPDTNFMNGVLFNPAGTQILLLGLTLDLALYDTATGAQSGTLGPHDDMVEAADFHPRRNWVATGTRRGAVYLWDLSTGSVLQQWPGSGAGVYRLKFCDDGSRLLSAAYGSEDEGAPESMPLRVLDPDSGRIVLEETGQAADLDGPGTRCAIAQGTEARIVDVNTGAVLYRLSGHRAFLRQLLFSPQETYLLSVSEDGALGIWDGATGLRKHLIPRADFAKDLLCTPDGQYTVFRTRAENIEVWNLASGERVNALAGSGVGISTLDIRPGTQNVASAGGGMVQLWSLLDSPGRMRIARYETAPTQIAVSRNGALLAAKARTHTTDFYAPASRRLLQRVMGNPGASAQALALSTDGAVAAIGLDGFTLLVWDVARQASLALLRHQGGEITGARFSASRPELAASCRDGRTRIWDYRDGTLLHELVGHTDAVNCLSYSGNDGVLATGGQDGDIRLWDPVTGAPLATLAGEHPISAVALSNDARFVAAPADKSSIQLWDTGAGKTLPILQGNSNSTALLFAPDDARLLALGRSALSVWDWRAAGQLAQLDTGLQNPHDVAFGASQETLFLCGASGEVVRVQAAPWNSAAFPGNPADTWETRFFTYQETLRPQSAEIVAAQDPLPVHVFLSAERLLAVTERLNLALAAGMATFSSGPAGIQAAPGEIEDLFIRLGMPGNAALTHWHDVELASPDALAPALNASLARLRATPAEPGTLRGTWEGRPFTVAYHLVDSQERSLELAINRGRLGELLGQLHDGYAEGPAVSNAAMADLHRLRGDGPSTPGSMQGMALRTRPDKPESRFYGEMGLCKGDWILSLNGAPIHTAGDFLTALQSLRAAVAADQIAAIPFEVLRGDFQRIALMLRIT